VFSVGGIVSIDHLLTAFMEIDAKMSICPTVFFFGKQRNVPQLKSLYLVERNESKTEKKLKAVTKRIEDLQKEPESWRK
jgi:hypothetical protein